jgi:hypothetical protein
MAVAAVHMQERRWAEAFGPKWIAGIASALIVAGLTAIGAIVLSRDADDERSIIVEGVAVLRSSSKSVTIAVRGTAKGVRRGNAVFALARPPGSPTRTAQPGYSISRPVVPDERGQWLATIDMPASEFVVSAVELPLVPNRPELLEDLQRLGPEDPRVVSEATPRSCADVAGPFKVPIGSPHELDRDGDGLACETT